jgi:hypothetical protein
MQIIDVLPVPLVQAVLEVRVLSVVWRLYLSLGLLFMMVRLGTEATAVTSRRNIISS